MLSGAQSWYGMFSVVRHQSEPESFVQVKKEIEQKK